MFEEYKSKLEEKEWLILNGFTSTSESKNVALSFMFKGLKKECVPVLYQIFGLSENG
jgi:hypothetical protein